MFNGSILYIILFGILCIHHLAGGVTHFLKQGTVYHLQVCRLLGRNSATHDAVRDMLSHLVVENGVTDAAVVEIRLTAAYRGTFDTDLNFPPRRG